MKFILFLFLLNFSFLWSEKLDFSIHIEYLNAYSSEKRIYDFQNKTIKRTIVDENGAKSVYYYKLKDEEVELLNLKITQLFKLKDCYSTEQYVIDGFITKIQVSKSKNS